MLEYEWISHFNLISAIIELFLQPVGMSSTCISKLEPFPCSFLCVGPASPGLDKSTAKAVIMFGLKYLADLMSMQP